MVTTRTPSGALHCARDCARAAPRRGSETTANTSPECSEARRTTSLAPSNRPWSITCCNSGWAVRQGPTRRSSLERARRKPSAPAGSTPMRTVVRSPTGTGSVDDTIGICATSSRSNPPTCDRASSTTSRRSSGWRSSATCWRSQPPQPAATNPHGGSTLDGELSMTSTTGPRSTFLVEPSSSTTTRSPPMPPVASTTRPSESRPRTTPPATGLSRRTSTRGSASGPSTSGPSEGSGSSERSGSSDRWS